jgi:hypothetical protein
VCAWAIINITKIQQGKEGWGDGGQLGINEKIGNERMKGMGFEKLF